MVLNKLKRQFEDRRLNLIETLQKEKEHLELSKQHQLYGAIKEIEQFLKAIDFHREQQVAKADFELKREGPPALSTRLAESLRHGAEEVTGAFSRAAHFLYDKLILGTGRAIRRTHKRIRLYKQALQEVKRRELGK